MGDKHRHAAYREQANKERRFEIALSKGRRLQTAAP
jgi:hypothetical protein